MTKLSSTQPAKPCSEVCKDLGRLRLRTVDRDLGPALAEAAALLCGCVQVARSGASSTLQTVAMADNVHTHSQGAVQASDFTRPRSSPAANPSCPRQFNLGAASLESPVFAKLADKASALSRVGRDWSQLFLGSGNTRAM